MKENEKCYSTELASVFENVVEGLSIFWAAAEFEIVEERFACFPASDSSESGIVDGTVHS